jgi:hypothetical protein
MISVRRADIPKTRGSIEQGLPVRHLNFFIFILNDIYLGWANINALAQQI